MALTSPSVHFKCCGRGLYCGGYAKCLSNARACGLDSRFGKQILIKKRLLFFTWWRFSIVVSLCDRELACSYQRIFKHAKITRSTVFSLAWISIVIQFLKGSFVYLIGKSDSSYRHEFLIHFNVIQLYYQFIIYNSAHKITRRDTY